jgi:hypothetical protein
MGVSWSAAASDLFTHSSELFRFDADNALLAFLIKVWQSVQGAWKLVLTNV